MWEQKEARARAILDKARLNYGSCLESGSFYFKIGNLERAEQSYLKAVVEANSFNIDNFADTTVVTSKKIRLIGSFYGLAQTYLALEKRIDAISALDSGGRTITELHDLDLDNILEEFGVLYSDLYVSLGEREQALSFCLQLLGIMPYSIMLKEKIQILMNKGSGQLLETLS